MLPVAETEIKEQQYLTKDKVQSLPEAESSSGSTLAPVKTAIGDTVLSLANGTGEPPISIEEAEFRSQVLAEFRTIASFKNNLGIPSGDLKALDGDALEQLESHLSIDDQ